MPTPNTIIIGGGVAGIAMAHALKWKLGYETFEIYEKHEGPGGTWRVNTYPGCGSDVPIHLYSFSFNLNPDWTQALAEREEILQCDSFPPAEKALADTHEDIESTVDKFGLRSHFRLNTECLGAKWSDKRQRWDVTFRNRATKQTFTKTCTVLLSAVGGFSQPRDISFPGMEAFEGRIFHTAEWDHSFDPTGKKIAVIGNGASAAQVVPSIAPSVKKLTQYARSAQWYHERPNRTFSALEKFCFRWIPLWQRYHRLKLFLQTDQIAAVYGPNPGQVEMRRAVEASAREYIYREAPQRYHSFIVPDFPLGCKRRIFDPGYLASLHRDNVNLLPEAPAQITSTGIISTSGKEEDFDAIILATGFQVQYFLASLDIVGKTGDSLYDQWEQRRGAQAYMGTFVHNFPNFAILFGPNTFPAFNSVIFSVEVQVEYIARTLVSTIIDHYADVFEVEETAEERFVSNIDEVLSQTVFSAGCSNWYINNAGRNAAAWPGLAYTFWQSTFFPEWDSFSLVGGTKTWIFHRVNRYLRKILY